MKDNINKKSYIYFYIIITLLLTWIFQFIPLILKFNISNTSISSFDLASVFFIIGGMLPSLIGGVFVIISYKKEKMKDFF